MRRRLLLIALVLALSLTVPACGTSDGSDGTAATTEPAEATTTVAPAAPSTTAAPPATDATGSTLSGVLNPPGVATAVDTPKDPGPTITWTKDKAWAPATLTVEPEEVFTVAAAPDAPPARFTFNVDDSYSVYRDITQSFTLEAPGTYAMRELVTGAEAKITVEG